MKYLSKNGLLMKIFFYLFISLSISIVSIFGLTYAGDFCQDYASAHYLLQGKPVYAATNCGLLKYNAHPPFTILLFIPFTFMSLPWATFVWSFFSLACYILSGLLLLNSLGWLSYRNSVLFLIVSNLWPSFIDSNIQQNVSQFLLLLFVCSWLLHKRNHSFWSGILLGVATLIRPWAVILLLGSLTNKQYKTSFAGFMTVILGILLSIPLLGWNTYVAYFGPIREYEYAHWILDPLNISLTGMLVHVSTLFVNINASTMHTIVTVGEYSSLITLFCILAINWKLNKKNNYKTFEYSQATLISIAFLTFPVSWGWGKIIFLLPCTLVVLALRGLPKQPLWLYILFGIGIISFTNFNTFFDIKSVIASYFVLFQTFGIILFIIGQLGLHYRIKK